MRLHELIAVQKDAILQRWMDRVRGTLAPSSLPQPELLDHLGDYLDELVEALRQAEGESAAATRSHESPVAQQHGHQRLVLGFDVPVLVHEYGVL
ncbi:MAG: RsbRD N-terminal domain-containing protein [Archangium sp.]|nr:RsbRD N-terminal domain-containing protein [Archangium sp.]MDP3575970.1 RsbRD N-terminal domain-containing protein [Archangium sp.]